MHFLKQGGGWKGEEGSGTLGGWLSKNKHSRCLPWLNSGNDRAGGRRLELEDCRKHDHGTLQAEVTERCQKVVMRNEHMEEDQKPGALFL